MLKRRYSGTAAVSKIEPHINVGFTICMRNSSILDDTVDLLRDISTLT